MWYSKTTPRKGTETIAVCFLEHFTKLLQFIPVRGRKPCRDNLVALALILQFIPARGRKLPPRHEGSDDGELQFIPARGRKLLIVNIDLNLRIAIYPRKGTETRIFIPRFHAEHIAIYPRKGTETAGLPFSA